jgi:anti-sigma factor RsiW
LQKSEPPQEAGHPDDLLLPYAEGLLNPEERASVGEHIDECAECFAQVETLRETIEDLRAHKGAFCPNLWELHEFAFHAHDAEGAVSEHIEDCASCREAVEAWKSEAARDRLPRQLWGRVNKALSEDGAREVRMKEQPIGFLERLRAMFDVPGWAIGAVTVVVLLAVFLYPRETPPSVIALSSVTWENAPKPKVLQPTSKRAAIIIVLKDFRPEPGRTKIDALYDAVTPTMDVYERYYVAPPATISEAVRKGLLDPSDRTKMLRGLRERLDLNKVVVITAVSKPEGMAFEADLIDTTAGKTLGKKTGSKLAEADLGPEMRRAALNLLLEN